MTRLIPIAGTQLTLLVIPRGPCQASPDGQHSQPVDLSMLKYQPTPPFCAWCGRVLEEADG